MGRNPFLVVFRHRVGAVRAETDVGYQIHIGRSGESAVVPDAGKPGVGPGVESVTVDLLEYIKPVTAFDTVR
jgi:hypothetical protein